MRCLGCAMLLISFLAVSMIGEARADQLQAVRHATTAMDEWLGTDANADAWRQYLHVEELQRLLSEGDNANPIEMMGVLKRFQQPVSGLDTPEFAAVRDALKNWLNATMTNEVWAEWISQQSNEFRPITDERLAAAREKAAAAVQELNDFLSYGYDENTTAWQDFLLSDLAQQQLALDDPNVDELGKIIAKYYSGNAGLEFKEFVQAREALLEYRRLLIAKSDPEVQARYAAQLANLSKGLAAGELSLAELAAQLEWFDQLGQAETMVDAIRAQYNQPNLYFSASADVISRGLSQPVDEETPVNEVILGTNIRGVARTVGKVTARLIPDPNKAMIEIVLNGVSNSETVGRQSGVSIFSNGTTQVLGRKLLMVGADEVVGMPATASCSTDSTITGIRVKQGVGSQMIEKIAWSRARQQQPKAEQISSRRAEQRVAKMMDDQAREMIATTNERLRSEIQKPLQQRNIFPRMLQLWTTENRLKLHALQGRNVQLAASTSPPEAPETDVVVQVHESLFLNSAVNAIGGYLMTDERAQDLVEEVTGEIPEELVISEDDDPWSITFDRLHPLTISFNDNQVVIAIRGRRFTRADQVVRQQMEVAATYSIEVNEGRVKLVRQGEIDVTYPGKEGQRLSLTELRNKTFMTNKFEGLFKPEIEGEGLKLPERLKELEDLKLDHISADNGWLSLGWN